MVVCLLDVGVLRLSEIGNGKIENVLESEELHINDRFIFKHSFVEEIKFISRNSTGSTYRANINYSGESPDLGAFKFLFQLFSNLS